MIGFHLLSFLFVVECFFVRTTTSFVYPNHHQPLQSRKIRASSSWHATTPTTSDTFSYVTSSSSSSSSKQNPWESFDYLKHWYPCCWDVDVPVNTPTQVTLFDVNYAIVRHELETKDGNDKTKKTAPTAQVVTAVVDQCPHRAALLSEGRVTEAGLLQCAYHGWTFNGTTGDCVDIPQAASTAGGGTSSSYSKRTCATAIPACIHQGLVWLWPGPVPEDNTPLPSPPTIPELDDPSFGIAGKAVRDFPMIDWTLLMSNILDPVR